MEKLQTMPTIQIDKNWTATQPTYQIILASCLTVQLALDDVLIKHYYCFGWQSWSPTFWTNLTYLPIQKPNILHPLQLDPFYARERRPHGSWIGAVEFSDGNIILFGALGLDAHVTFDKDKLLGKYEGDAGDWFIAYGEEMAVFGRYGEELAKRFGKRRKKATPRVWCSWYSLYTGIDEPSLHRTFDDFGDFPFDVLQVDDGWQIGFGDWEANSKFPSGMSALAEKIKSTNRRAGLWVAPLVATKSSTLFQKHPDWFLQNERPQFISAGFSQGKQLYALDTTHSAVLEWLAKLMNQVRRWGFDYVKIDYLYAGALPGKRRMDVPREVAYRNGLTVIRGALGEDAFLLGCGAPIIPSLGLCDALRIGADVFVEWENELSTRLLHNMAAPGARNAIRTVINRLWLGSLVQLDPDVVFFRSKECLLTDEQKSLMKDLALICDFKSTSDLPQLLNSKERESLFLVFQAIPEIRQITRYDFQIDNRVVDFSYIMSPPSPLQGFEIIKGVIIGWLANLSLALKVVDWIQKREIEQIKRRLSRK